MIPTAGKEVIYVKTWLIEGYAGFYDYDGPGDYNFHYVWTMDASITKEEIGAILQHRYKNQRTLVYTITEQ